jgi:hypothetical protein
MKLLVVRESNQNGPTLGKLFVDNVYFCETLEDQDRQLETKGESAKVEGETCIPRGEYRVLIDFSHRFRCEMMHVMDVPYFEGIRIHAGNTKEDTHGCLLLGSARSESTVLNSRYTVKRLFDLVDSALGVGEDVTIEYK